MPATGLKIVGTGACLPWCSISSSFQNSLKTSGHRGYEFLEFWCWNLVPFLPDIVFQLLKSLWSSLTYFPFNDAPNVLYRWKIWNAMYSALSLTHRDFSSFSECFDDVMHCRWWDLQSLCNLTLSNIVFLSITQNFLRTLSQIGELLPIFTSERLPLKSRIQDVGVYLSPPP